MRAYILTYIHTYIHTYIYTFKLAGTAHTERSYKVYYGVLISATESYLLTFSSESRGQTVEVTYLSGSASRRSLQVPEKKNEKKKRFALLYFTRTGDNAIFCIVVPHVAVSSASLFLFKSGDAIN